MGSARFEISNSIRRLNRCDTAKLPYEYFCNEYGKLTKGFRTCVGMTAGSELFFRVRKNMRERPSCVSDLSAPPPSRVVGYQRCNPPNVPMFYASSTRLGALIESRVEAGDIVYLSQWIGRDKLPVNKIFDESVDHSSQSTYRELDSIVISHFDTLFTQKIHDKFSADYKKTSAIAQLLTSRFPPNEEHDIRSDRNIALRYPSVHNLGSCFNTAMHASFARERLSILHVAEIKIGADVDGHLLYSVADTAWKFDGDEVFWSGRSECMPIFKLAKNAVPFISDGSRWNLRVCESAMSQEELTRLIEE